MVNQVKNKLITDINEFENRISKLSPYEAEDAILKILKPLLQTYGFKIFPVTTTHGVRIDFLATKQNESIGIVFKHYRINKVDIDHILSSVGTVAYNQLDRVILLSSSSFSKQACITAQKINPLPIELFDINSLKSWASKIEADFDDSAVVQVVKRLIENLITLIIKNTRSLDEIEWRDMERIIAELFKGIGFTVQLTPASKDGGKDVILDCVLNGTNNSFIVEIKHWRSGQKVGPKRIIEFLKAVAKEKRNGGLLLSTYGFTENAVEGLTEIDRNLVKFGQENKIVTLCQTYLKRKSGLWHVEEDLPKLLFENTL